MSIWTIEQARRFVPHFLAAAVSLTVWASSSVAQQAEPPAHTRQQECQSIKPGALADACRFDRLAQYLLDHNDPQRAFFAANDAIAAQSHFGRAYFDRAEAYSSLNQCAEAIKDYDEALGIAHKDSEDPPEIYIGRALCYAALNQPQKAIKDFTDAIEIAPAQELYVLRGNLLTKIQQYSQAVKDFTAAIQLDPTQAEPYFRRGKALFGNEQFGQAVMDFNKALKLNPGDVPSLAFRGAAYTGWARLESQKPDYLQKAGKLDRLMGLARSDLERAETLKTDTVTVDVIKYALFVWDSIVMRDRSATLPVAAGRSSSREIRAGLGCG